MTVPETEEDVVEPVPEGAVELPLDVAPVASVDAELALCSVLLADDVSAPVARLCRVVDEADEAAPDDEVPEPLAVEDVRPEGVVPFGWVPVPDRDVVVALIATVPFVAAEDDADAWQNLS